MSPRNDAVTGARCAIVLHRPHATVDAIARQLTQIGVETLRCWPDLPEDVDPSQYRVLFFDADMGYDAQFYWAAGETPIPAIALIGSEAPGRVAWAITRGADAHLLKPVGSGGIYSAVLIATEAFERRWALRAEVCTLVDRVAKREDLAGATALLMVGDGLTATEAFHKLRRLAMTDRVTIETMAARLLQHSTQGRRHDRA